MKDYSLLDDKTIIELSRKGDVDALDYLMYKYKGIVRNKARFYFLLSGDYEDVIQEGMIGLYNAYRKYDATQEASFATFADICVTRRIISAIRIETKRGTDPLLNSISFDDEDLNAEDEFQAKNSYIDDENPEEKLIRQEEKNDFHMLIDKKLSSKEKQILQLFIKGFSYNEISEKLGINNKSVDNALMRIKKKLKKGIVERRLK